MILLRLCYLLCVKGVCYLKTVSLVFVGEFHIWELCLNWLGRWIRPDYASCPSRCIVVCHDIYTQVLHDIVKDGCWW